MTLLSRLRQTVSALTQPIAEPLDLSLELEGPNTPAASRPRTADPQFCRAMRGAVSDQTLARAWRKLEESMALVPRGEVRMFPLIASEPGGSQTDAVAVSVESFYVDRLAVTNDEFRQFVDDDGYNREEFWPPETLSYLLQFIDESGTPGPKFWKAGKPPAGKGNHPVAGVSWYEARAFAQWAGKQLPTSAQWQQAACWFTTNDGPRGTNFPWGNVFNPEFTNTWHSGRGETVAADSYDDGATPNGVYQLIGNVWEWTACLLGVSTDENGNRLVIEHPMAELRGGAFDTYFETQATCQFRTGQRLVYRGPNVGFRCCVLADDLPPPPDPSAFAVA
jgi:formylglycine-generating enzyme required for sulfatase activity